MYRTKDTKKKHDIPERLETLYNINIEKHYITYRGFKRNGGCVLGHNIITVPNLH